MKKTKKMIKMEERLSERKFQLLTVKLQLQKKINRDTINYGIPLGNKQLRDKIEKQEERIMELSLKIKKENEARFTLSRHDQKVLNAIRNNSNNINTASETSNVDNRFKGSANSRRNARYMHRRG